MKRERGILISVVTAALVMVLLCIFFTSDRAVSVKKLKKCVPDEVHFEEDGREQYDFLMEAYGEAPGQLCFIQHIRVLPYMQTEKSFIHWRHQTVYGVIHRAGDGACRAPGRGEPGLCTAYAMLPDGSTPGADLLYRWRE